MTATWLQVGRVPLMPISPRQAADDVLDRAFSVLAHSNTVSDSLLADDLRRFALAQGVAALDTYLHWAIADAPLDKGMPSKLKSLDVPFEDLIALSDAVLADRNTIRPRVRARKVLERVTLTMSFQSSRGVETAMLMLGVRKAFNKISAEIKPSQTPSETMKRLNRIVHRRNQIVHEGDLQRQSRPQKVKREKIVAHDIKTDLDWIRSLVVAVDSVLTA